MLNKLLRFATRLARAAGIRRPRLIRGERMAAPVDARRIRTRRLTLRPHRIADAAQWFELQSHESVTEYLSWPVRDEAASLEHLRHRTRHTRLLQVDDFLALGVELDGRLIGDVSLHLRTVGAGLRAAEVGWVQSPDFGHRGFATEAVNAMLDLAINELEAKWVYAVIRNENMPALALAKRLGFVELTRDAIDVTLLVTPTLRAEQIHRENGVRQLRPTRLDSRVSA
jgi:RimJ/RimL family protein N-acetyltransferase